MNNDVFIRMTKLNYKALSARAKELAEYHADEMCPHGKDCPHWREEYQRKFEYEYRAMTKP